MKKFDCLAPFIQNVSYYDHTRIKIGIKSGGQSFYLFDETGVIKFSKITSSNLMSKLYSLGPFIQNVSHSDHRRLKIGIKSEGQNFYFFD